MTLFVRQRLAWSIQSHRLPIKPLQSCAVHNQHADVRYWYTNSVYPFVECKYCVETVVHIVTLSPFLVEPPRCASGCVVECRICNSCRFESRPGLLRTKVYSTFHPSGVGKWVPVIAGKAKAGMAHSDCGWTCGCAGKTVKSLENTYIPERFCGGDSLRRGAISSVWTSTFRAIALVFFERNRHYEMPIGN